MHRPAPDDAEAGGSQTSATITLAAYRRAVTNPDNPDTDGDGLRDGQEACARRTDPTNPDTDGDGLTDYEEVYAFSYNNATSSTANVTVNVTTDAVSELHWKVQTSATRGGGSSVEAVVYLDGQLMWKKTSAANWTNVLAEFDAILPKGLHSLQVQRATATGTVTLTLVNVTKPRFTNALYWDTDADRLSDGDELLGKTGWILSPTKADTDVDGLSDSTEVQTTHTDPLLLDTDHDGVNDGADFDPLHDLVVQLVISEFLIGADSCQTCTLYQAVGTVGQTWTRSQAGNRTWAAFPNHVLSVNVRDDQRYVAIKLQIFNNHNPAQEMDVSTQTGQTAYTTTADVLAPDVYGVGPNHDRTCGEVTSPQYGCVYFAIHIVRVGKANTLLMVPSDWSTLSNGTVNGKATGLHRYVGEQRFAFALLNVTDGAGDVVSFDLESRGYDGAYVTRNSFIEGCAAGATPESGRFGGAVRLTGSGSYVKMCPWFSWLDPTRWLNGIYRAMTVSFWIRPDVDYAGGSGWAWSFGRKDVWRVGYYAGGLRFEAKDSVSGVVRNTPQVSMSLRAGVWYEVAATLEYKTTVSDLELYVNGGRIAPCASCGTVSLSTSSISQLYLGYDEASAAAFKGTVDEFQLSAKTLSWDAIRGLTWFAGGTNSVLIPRGVFYDSLLFKQMTSTNSSDNVNGPLKDAVVQSNANNGSAHLNSAVIQMTIVKNITLADSYLLLTQLWTNKTGHVTAFAFPATAEFYTLGFAWEVSKLVGNTSVANGANYTTPTWTPPTPPPNLCYVRKV